MLFIWNIITNSIWSNFLNWILHWVLNLLISFHLFLLLRLRRIVKAELTRDRLVIAVAGVEVRVLAEELQVTVVVQRLAAVLVRVPVLIRAALFGGRSPDVEGLEILEGRHEFDRAEIEGIPEFIIDVTHQQIHPLAHDHVDQLDDNAVDEVVAGSVVPEDLEDGLQEVVTDDHTGELSDPERDAGAKEPQHGTLHIQPLIAVLEHLHRKVQNSMLDEEVHDP